MNIVLHTVENILLLLDVIIAAKGLPNLDICSAISAFELRWIGILIIDSYDKPGVLSPILVW